jgi:hypothetical protein
MGGWFYGLRVGWRFATVRVRRGYAFSDYIPDTPAERRGTHHRRSGFVQQDL